MLPKSISNKMKSGSSKEGAFITYLLISAVQAHVHHLTVSGNGSYAAHKALNEYNDGIVDLADGIAESLTGSKGSILGGYSGTFSINEDPKSALPYLKEVLAYVNAERASVSSESFIQNQIDNVVELLNSTIYKLTQLS